MSSYRMKYRIGSTQYNIPVMDDISGFGSGIPVGTVLPFMGSTLPSGFLWCDGSAVSRTLFPDLFTAIGTAFGSGDGSTTFNLPKLDSGEFLEGSSYAGTSKDAGLPNISFSTDRGKYQVNSYASYDTSNDALVIGTGIDGANVAFDGSSHNNIAIMTGSSFDASKANSIYGNSQTVQPKSLTTCYIIKAFDSQSQASALIDVTQYASALNQKPSKSLNDLTQTGEDHFLEKDWCYIYPNNGTAANPADVTKNSRYVMDNPFSGYAVCCIPEILLNGQWGNPCWQDINTSGNRSYGISVTQLDNSNIIIQTGNLAVKDASFMNGDSFGDVTQLQSAPCRVKVWKIGKIPTQSP